MSEDSGSSLLSSDPAKRADVAIIGGGPIGLELAAGLKHAGVKYVQFEAGSLGWTMSWWAPGTRFFSSSERIEIAGVPLALTHQEKATREEYLTYLRAVVRQHALQVHSSSKVVRIEHAPGAGFSLAVARSTQGVGGPHSVPFRPAPDALSAWHVQQLVLAIGDMHRPRLLGVTGEDLPHVSHYLAEAHEYFGQRVLIVGGKNSAVEAALRLYRCGARVAISYRGSEFDPKRIKHWLRPELEWLIERGKIDFHPRTVVKMIESDRVELAPVEGNSAVKARQVPADRVLLLTGYVQDPVLFDQLGVALVGDERVPQLDPKTMQTDVAGAYVAGTAAAGSQSRAKLFIENSHVHVHRIVRSIAGVVPPWPLAESLGALEQ
ncbi:MAG: NAD(P)-binding domain-containing protein [Phycisphaerales bacterium]|nr:NAD(P)-binding domain-containing protein [Phycisphaerales bacterium]